MTYATAPEELRCVSSYMNRVTCFNVEEPTYDYTLLMARMHEMALAIRARWFFDTIAFTGTSGGAIAWPLSMMMRVPVTIVRKPEENSHHNNGSKPYGQLDGQIRRNLRYLFVDDIIDSGRTFLRVEEEIRRVCGAAKMVACLMYGYSGRKEYQGVPCFSVEQKDWREHLRTWGVKPAPPIVAKNVGAPPPPMIATADDIFRVDYDQLERRMVVYTPRFEEFERSIKDAYDKQGVDRSFLQSLVSPLPPAPPPEAPAEQRTDTESPLPG